MVGSLPHQNVHEALSLVHRYLPDIPAWPQLPRRSFMENMYVQFSQKFPSIQIEGERIYVDRERDFDEELESLYLAYLNNSFHLWEVTPEYAQGLHSFLNGDIGEAVAVKGQVTGPISWGLSVTDQDRRPILYDDILGDAIAKHLRLKASWQERRLRVLSPRTIVFVDEPFMSAFGSAFVSLSREQVISQLEEVFQGITGLTGIHCCANTDWSVLLATSVDVLNLDAYGYAHSLSLYPEEVAAFLKRGGIIAWGIVPNDEEALAHEGVASLVSRLEEAVDALVRKGVDEDLLWQRCLITPSCGLGGLPIAAAERVLELTQGVSQELQRRYVKDAQK